MSYGDGLANVDIKATVDFRRQHGRRATMTVVRPPASFGAVDLDGDEAVAFREKHPASEGFVDRGFFVLSADALDYVDGDDPAREAEPLERLVRARELMCLRRDGFWQSMDTLRDRLLLGELWETSKAPWELWT